MQFPDWHTYIIPFDNVNSNANAPIPIRDGVLLFWWVRIATNSPTKFLTSWPQSILPPGTRIRAGKCHNLGRTGNHRVKSSPWRQSFGAWTFWAVIQKILVWYAWQILRRYVHSPEIFRGSCHRSGNCAGSVKGEGAQVIYNNRRETENLTLSVTTLDLLCVAWFFIVFVPISNTFFIATH